MRKIWLGVLYTALMVGANPVAADVTAARALLAGDMKKLMLWEAARPVPGVALFDASGAEVGLDHWRGQWVLVNFWATWCAPCRAEMPSLDRLAGLMPDLAVLPVATGPNPQAAVDRFWAETAVVNLSVLRDPKSDLAHAMAVMGLPVTVILNPEGQEVARLIGDVVWDGPEARAALQALIDP